MMRLCFRFLKSEEKLWCVRDPCGIICAVVTYLLVAYAEVAVMLTILLPYPTAVTAFQFLAFNVLAFLAVSSHIRAMLTDPGTVPRGISEFSALRDCEEADNAVIKHCHRCNSIKPVRAHHCSVCQRCVRKMDHHCPWINNCVGENNQKFFVLFTLYICAISVLAGVMVGMRFFSCSPLQWNGCLLVSETATFVLMTLLLFEAALFSLFTLIMFITQIFGIATDHTGIERLKRQTGWKRRTICLNFQTVFGGPLSLSWLSPFSVSPARRKHRVWPHAMY